MTPGPLRRILGLARRAADPTDDAGLLARFAATADADAFELLVWRHGGMVLGVARRILGDAHAAEDAFQATFLALARRASSVRRGGCVAAWLHRVARRVAIRAKGRERIAVNRLRFARNVNPDSPDDPIAAAERSELCHVLDEELDRLPERFRRAVVLCYLEGRSTAEAAERLGCPRGTVLSRLAAAREKLKARLMRRGMAPAILPALDLPPVIHGGLTSATVRAAVANTATPQVIDLCDGVIRAMILSKLKITAAVVMTFGLIGGGAGWMALTPGGPGAALAGPQAKADAPRPEPAQEQQRRVEEQTDRLRVELAKAEDLLMVQEERWARDRIDARLRFAEAEDRYKQLAKTLAQYMSAEALQMEWSLEDEVNSLRSSLSDALKKSAKGEKDPQIAEMRSSLDAAESNLKTTRETYGRLQAAMRQARGAMVTAEEQLSLFDRLTALKRRSAQTQVEDLQDRMNQLHGGAGRSDPADHKVKELERKLDDVLRELTELRRELRK